MNIKIFYPLLLLIPLASCGNKSSVATNLKEQELEEKDEGSYRAILRPYNNSLSGRIPNGMTDIKITKDAFEVKSWLDDSANVTHQLAIHVGKKCPDLGADKNNDGYIDFIETVKVSGRILIPLDADLNSQSLGANNFPFGNFTYYQKASLKRMMKDLRQADLDANDFTVKLSGQERINLAGKIIVVTGVDKTKFLPASVSTFDENPATQTIPIACGVIQRLNIL